MSGSRADLPEILSTRKGRPATGWKHEGMMTAPAETDDEARLLIRHTRRVLTVVLALVLAGVAVGVLIPMREIGHTWSDQDVVECQGSAFVEHAGTTGGPPAADAAIQECTAHRRAKRWGPWGALGNADDSSKYNGADD